MKIPKIYISLNFRVIPVLMLEWGIPLRAFLGLTQDDRGVCWETEKEHLLVIFSSLRVRITFRCECYYYTIGSPPTPSAQIQNALAPLSVLYGAARYNLCFTSTRSRGRNNSSGSGALHTQGESDVGSSGSQIKKNPSLVLLLHIGPRSPGPLLFYHQRAFRDIIQLSPSESGKLTRLRRASISHSSLSVCFSIFTQIISGKRLYTCVIITYGWLALCRTPLQ